MTIIDRYMLRQFLWVFSICFISFTGLYVVIDAFGNLDEFISFAEKKGSLIGIMGSYYGYRSLSFFDRTSGLLALVSAMFTVTWIQRHHELTAILAAGIPSFRVVAPVIAAAASISLLAAGSRELVLPEIREHLSYNAQNLGGEQARDVKSRYDHASGILLRGNKCFVNEKRIENPNFLLPTGLDQLGRYLTSANAYFQEETTDRPSGYLLKGVTAPKGLTDGPSIRSEEGPVVLTPVDYDWLKKDECFVASHVTFEMLEGGQGWQTYSSTGELIEGLRSPGLDFGADVSVAVHGRFVQPALDITLLFLGLPLILSRSNRNVFVAISLCVGIALLFMVVVMGCQYLGSNYLISPSLSVWLPLMVFIPVAAMLSDPLWE